MSDKPVINPIRVTIVGTHRGCPQGFKVGDSWLIDDGKTPAGMCANAYHSIFQYIRVFRYGGKHPWDKIPGVIRLGCPDPIPHLVYEVKVENPEAEPASVSPCDTELDVTPPASIYTGEFDPISITVVSMAGTCPQGYKVGDNWIFDGKAPENMCASAYHSLFPTLRVFRFGGQHPWENEDNKGIANIGCPDTTNRLIYQLKVLKQKDA